MNIYAIADLHLSGDPPTKPMDLFGSHWNKHWEKIRADWLKKVTEHDVVLLAGDISWAMKWEEVRIDLEAIAALPGRKIMIRGNHDYWWQTISKMTQAMGEKITFLQNNYIAAGEWAICGSRGWTCPQDTTFTEKDLAIYHREIARVKLSLESAKHAGFEKIILMLHYPPTNQELAQTGFTDLLAEYGVNICVFGHLHGDAAGLAPAGLVRGTHYYLVACDALEFQLQHIVSA